MSELTEYADRVATIDESAFLGRLCWYNIPELRMKHEDVIRALVDAGIDTNLPMPPKDVDVFRRVCTANERKRVPTDDPGVFVNYRMVEFTDTDSVVRRIVRQEVDNKGKKLGHREVVDVRFARATSHVSWRPLGYENDSDANAIAVQISKDFTDQQGCLNAYAVREWVRHFILRLGATPVRPGGGVYFIGNQHRERIEALEEFAKKLPSACTLHSLPLIDDRKQRDMVRDAYEAETAGEVRKLLDEITELRKGGGQITELRYQEYLTRLADLTDKTKDYEHLLEDSLTNTHSLLSIFQKSILGLSEIVKW